jgi:hypothetical protein
MGGVVERAEQKELNMSKQNTIARSAKHLTPYNVSQIRRRNLIKAAIERLETLETRLKEKLSPVFDAEIGGEKVLLVEVKGTVVRLNKVNKSTTLYKTICEELADESMLKAMLNDVLPDGTHRYLTESSYVSAKILGRESTAANILNP